MGKTVSENEWQNIVIEASKARPVLIDFYAAWCAPCRAMEPTIAALAVEKAGSLQVISVDVEASPAVSEAYGVFAMPTFILFRDGAEVARCTGAMPKAKLVALLGLQ